MMNYNMAYQVIRRCYADTNMLSKERESVMEKYPVYPKGYIFNEDESVRWNREEVQRRQEAREKAQKKYDKKVQEIWGEAEKAIKDYLQSEFDLKPKVADAVYAKAREEGHSGGFFEILSKANDYGSFVEIILSLSKKEE